MTSVLRICAQRSLRLCSRLDGVLSRHLQSFEPRQFCRPAFFHRKQDCLPASCSISGNVAARVRQLQGRGLHSVSGYDGAVMPGISYSAASTVEPYVVGLPLDAVIKVFSTVSAPNYLLPWQNKPQRELTGSGFVIHGRRILTNAHVVADQTFVYVRKHGSPVKYPAKVGAAGHECDIALLTVDDAAFWEDLTPLELGGVPELQDAVSVIGYPTGGDNISVTGGVVSRVEPQQYAHGAAHLLAIQIDAAINPGNSGGPAVKDDKVVGIAFQNLVGADNIGFIIPVPIIEHFLTDLDRSGAYIGFCSLGVTAQPMDNAHLRRFMRMTKAQTGILVNSVQPLSDSSGKIRKGDVVIGFDGHRVGNDGTVLFRNRERIPFDYLTSMKYAGETATVTVLRDGKEQDVDIVMNTIKSLVPVQHFDKLPSYVILAGLVFTPLSQPYLHEYGDDWYNTSPRRLCDRAMYGILEAPAQQVVVLSQVLADEINLGYQTMVDLTLKAVNGVKVVNLKHMYELIRDSAEPFLRLDFDDDRVIALDAREAQEATEAILQRHRISHHLSADLQAHFQPQPDLYALPQAPIS